MYIATTGNQPTICTMNAVFLILLYNGTRGKLKLKYFLVCAVLTVIPTRCWVSYSNGFCFRNMMPCSFDYLIYPYYSVLSREDLLRVCLAVVIRLYHKARLPFRAYRPLLALNSASVMTEFLRGGGSKVILKIPERTIGKQFLCKHLYLST